jgi:hypothetical protein
MLQVGATGIQEEEEVSWVAVLRGLTFVHSFDWHGKAGILYSTNIFLL